jgi:hypothetical protein
MVTIISNEIPALSTAITRLDLPRIELKGEEELIVIATHNHNIALLRLLKSIQQNGERSESSSLIPVRPNPSILRKTIQSTYPSVVLDRTAKPDYDTGAYLHAFRYYKDEEYLFLHDSLEVIQPDFMTAFRQTATDLDTVVRGWASSHSILRTQTYISRSD